MSASSDQTKKYKKGPSRERVSNPISIQLKKIIAAIVPVFFRTITSLLQNNCVLRIPPSIFITWCASLSFNLQQQ
jgi:hypothetical protein